MGDLATRDLPALLELLAPDVVLVSDGGADQHAARRPVVGAGRVARFLVTTANRRQGVTTELRRVNGEPGVVVRHGGAPVAVVTVEMRDHRIHRIRIVANVRRLDGLETDIV